MSRAAPTPSDGRAIAAKRGGKLVPRLIMLVVIVFFVLPILYLLSTAFKAPGEIQLGRFLPEDPILDNWSAAFQAVPLLAFMRNSLLASLLSALITLTIALPATYAMIRLRIAERFLGTFTLATYVAPPIVVLIPLFFLMQMTGLMNSVIGLALVYGLMNTPVAFWLMRSFVKQVPEEIDEAAWIDGAGYFSTFVRIVLPLLGPGLVATGLICVVLAYNEFLFASAMTFGPESRTLTVGISLFQGERLVNFGQMAAASMAGMVPIYLVALFFQKWLIGGLTQGSSK